MTWREHLVLSMKLGAVVGSVTGLLEVFAQWLGGSLVITRQFLFPAMVMYGLAWGVVGVGLGLLRGLRRKGASVDATDAAWYATVLVASAVVVMVGGYANLYWLPTFTSRSSLVFDTILVLGVFLLARVFGFPALKGWLSRRQPIRGPRRVRRFLITVTVLIAVLALTYVPSPRQQGFASPSRARLPCNVLFIVLDAVRADHLSGYGYPRQTSPHLDRLARRGVRFANATANSSWTHASIPTILTSRYPSTHQVNLIASGLPASIPTLPQVLKQEGMATAMFSGNTFVSPAFGFGRGVDLFVYGQPLVAEQLILGHVIGRITVTQPLIRGVVKEGLKLLNRLSPQVSAATDEQISARELNQAFFSWLNETLPQRFFAYLHYMEPHAPYNPPEPYRTLFLANPEEAPAQGVNVPQVLGILPFAHGEPRSAQARQRVIDLYDGEIRLLDDALGELFDGLERRRILEDTAIIVTADHGEEFFDHGGWQHGHSLYQELLHVPLILSFPRRVPMHRVVDTRVSHVDVMPTILALCGIDPGLSVEGKSLLPLFEGHDDQLPERDAYSELYHGGASARALIRGPYKVIASEHGSERHLALYDVHRDAGETRDLSAQMPTVVSSLMEALEGITERAAAQAGASATAKLDRATQEQLRALGYLQ